MFCRLLCYLLSCVFSIIIALKLLSWGNVELHLLLFSGGQSVAHIKPQTGRPARSAPRTGRSHCRERRGRKQRCAKKNPTTSEKCRESITKMLHIKRNHHTTYIHAYQQRRHKAKCQSGCDAFKSRLTLILI